MSNGWIHWTIFKLNRSHNLDKAGVCVGGIGRTMFSQADGLYLTVYRLFCLTLNT